MAPSVALPPEYGFVVIVAAVIGLQILVTGGRVAAARNQVFTAAYYRQPAVQRLLDDHKRVTGQNKLPKGGYPDMGSGRYTDLASYADWYAFNNAQRAHYNYLEGVASVLVFLLLGGLFFPVQSAVAGAAYVLGRELYTWGYINSGPSGRNIGVTILDIALIVLLICCVTGGLQLCGWSVYIEPYVQPLVSLVNGLRSQLPSW